MSSPASGAPTEGWLTKRGNRIKVSCPRGLYSRDPTLSFPILIEQALCSCLQTWHKRFFILSGATLKWHTKPGVEPKGILDISGARVTRMESDKKRATTGLIVYATARELWMQADNEADATRWLNLLTNAAGKAGGLSPSSGAGSAASPVPSAAALAAASSLPQMVEVDGTAEVGCELRVRLTNSRLLDSLCMAWFRYSAEGLVADPDPRCDISQHPSVKVISGATASSYTVTEADVGFRLGCIVRPVSNLASRWSLMGVKVRNSATSASNEAWVHVSVLPHEHHKYCDRRVRVCTAGGMHREGNVLVASLRGKSLVVGTSAAGSNEVPAGYKIVWFRSDVVEARQLGSLGLVQSRHEDAIDARDMAIDGVPQSLLTPPSLTSLSSSPPALGSAAPGHHHSVSLSVAIGEDVPLDSEFRPYLKKAGGVASSGSSSVLTGAGGSSSTGLTVSAPSPVLASGAPSVPASPALTPMVASTSAAPGTDALTLGASSVDTDDDDDDDEEEERRDTLAAMMRGEAPAIPLHSGNVVANPRFSTIWRKLPKAVLRRVRPRPLEGLPTPPPDHIPSPPFPEITRGIAALTGPRGDLLRSMGLIPADSAGRCSGDAYPHSNLYPLCRDDVGRLLCAALMPADASEPNFLYPADLNAGAAGAGLGSVAGSLGGSYSDRHGNPITSILAVSLPAGPIDAAPPKAREIWVEGTQAVGSLLIGKCFYFGGYEGQSKVSWTAITDDGDTVEIKPPTPALALPDGEQTAVDDSHPRVLRLTEKEKGCLIKFKVQPIRSDGDEGHGEASRPTSEIATTAS
jgi:PH domain